MVFLILVNFTIQTVEEHLEMIPFPILISVQKI